MPRRTFLRFTTIRLPEPEVVAYYIQDMHPRQLHSDWDVFPRITSANLFGNDAPLELEVGCGSAEQLCYLAHCSPERNFVGVDISLKSLHKGVEIAHSYGLRNLRFLHADFQLMYPLLVPQSVQAVYLHFPDPHYKLRHRKRRIFNQAFLDVLHATLVPGGRLSVMTDVEAFFYDMLHLIEDDPRFSRAHPERYLLGFSTEVRSRFQKIWENYGETIYRFAYQNAARSAQ